jgi:tetratricopeptide (TPR) repeat protein
MSALREALRRAEDAAQALGSGDEERAELALEVVAEPAAQASDRAPATQNEAPASQAAAPAADVEPASRGTFLLVVGPLAAAAAAAGGYFWLALRPATPTARAPIPATVAEAKVAAPARVPLRDDLLGLARREDAPAIAPSAAFTSAAPAAARSTLRRTAAPTVAQPIVVVEEPAARRGEPRVAPQVATGYAALQAYDLGRARTAYRQALEAEPFNRDALLGIAAVEMYARRFAQAEVHLRRLLRVRPADTEARAGLIALAARHVNPVRAEAEAKSFLAGEPKSAWLHFTLGNAYARQGRWAEARRAYLDAARHEPDNPDVTFNLAVSCDRLGQAREARELYARALLLAGRRAALFPPAAAQRRLRELER